jgi:hypothetical protein
VQNNAKFKAVYYSNKIKINLIPYSRHYKKKKNDLVLFGLVSLVQNNATFRIVYYSNETNLNLVLVEQ